jgi:hypothetical protein
MRKRKKPLKVCYNFKKEAPRNLQRMDIDLLERGITWIDSLI